MKPHLHFELSFVAVLNNSLVNIQAMCTFFQVMKFLPKNSNSNKLNFLNDDLVIYVTCNSH